MMIHELFSQKISIETMQYPNNHEIILNVSTNFIGVLINLYIVLKISIVNTSLLYDSFQD
jgi:hypothetical protein